MAGWRVGGGGAQVEGRKERGEREGGVVGRAEWRGRVDLGMMLARLEVIRSDFDVVAEKRARPPLTPMAGWRVGGGGAQPELISPNPHKETANEKPGDERVCPKLLSRVVERVSEEMLAADFNLCKW